MYPPLFSLNNLVDVPSTRTDPQEMYPLLFSVNNPSRCTDASSIGACRPRIFFINGFLCFLEDEWQRNGERKRERRRHFKEKMSLEKAHHHRRPWIRACRKKEMSEGRGREEHEILCSK
ncbi:hypothetical protein GmHk_10G028501 [Glycine max]|nr:hypothetical protein GmHk_10G028501 [Glycine max]